MAKWQASKSDMSPRKGYIPEIEDSGTLTHCGRVVEWEDHDCSDNSCCVAVCVKCSAEWPDCEDRSAYAGQGK
jgi:hypothetical protein